MSKKKRDKSPVGKLENDLRATEEQALLYAKDIARIFMERKEKERQLELTRRQLTRSARIALLGQMAAGIAHEVNNALTPAVGHISILLMKNKDLPKEILDRLALIETSLDKASSMLNQLLDLSRKKPEKREPGDICAILENNLSMLNFKLLKNNIVVRKELQHDIPKIMVDETRIGQVFTNLTLNAIDAMEVYGTLTVSIGYFPETSKNKYPYVRILFKDTGCGITPDLMEHIFEPFFTTKETKAGTGLGLFVSYGIIEKHGGTIDVESTQGEGTEFKICLPAF